MTHAEDRAPVLVDLEDLPDPYVVLRALRDATGRITDFAYVAANRAALVDLQLSREEVLSSTLLGLHDKTGDGVLFDDFIAVVDGGEVLALEDLEYRNAPPDGRPRFYDVSAARRGDGVICAWWDVTQRYEGNRQLAVAEAGFRATLDSLLDPHQTLAPVRDDGGRIVDFEYVQVNRASCAYLGRAREELLGRRVREVWTGPAVGVVLDWARTIAESGEPLRLDEQPVEVRAGDVRMIDVRGVLVGDAVSFTFRDVTQRVALAREVVQSREHFRLLAENASEIVLQTGPNGMLSWVSPSITRTLGWPVDELVGKPLTQFIHPDDVPDVIALQKTLLASGQRTGRTACRVATADGGWRWMSVLGQALVDENGSVVGGVDALRDIQAERDALGALAESEERFRRAMMDSAIGMAMVSPLGQFMRVNPALCSLLGRDEHELMRATWQELTHPDDLERDESLLREVLRGQRDTYGMDKRYLRPDGRVVWADLTVSSVRDEDGHVRYLISQVVDITDSVLAREALARSEEHYRLLAENSSDVVFRSSVDARLEWVSPSVVDVLGWAVEDVVGRSMLDFVEPDDIPGDLPLEPGNTQAIDFVARVRTSGAAPLWMDIDVRPLFDDGRLIGRVGRLRDVQAEHDTQEALRRSEQRFRTAMESAPTGMAVVGLNREFLEVNPALCRLLGRTEDWLLSRSLGDVLDPLDDDLDRRLRAQILAGVVPSMTRDHQMIRSDGERVLVEQSIGLLRDDHGRATAYVSQFADVTEARETRERLRFLATHDPMTELLNRRELVTRISGVLGQTPRTGVNVGVLFIDLDGLKPLNDTHGHAVGDAVIVTVARRIRGQVRTNDVLARFGGDEFVLVLPAIHDVEDAERIAASLHSAVEVPMTVEDRQLSITLSIGVAVVRPGEEPDVAMRRADTALYRAKREGKARTAVYDPQLDGA